MKSAPVVVSLLLVACLAPAPAQSQTPALNVAHRGPQSTLPHSPDAYRLTPTVVLSSQFPRWTDDPDETLHFDGPNDDGLGLVRGGTFYCAARFTPVLACSLKAILFYHSDASRDAAVYVAGPGTDTTPGAILDSAQYSAGPIDWVRADFTTPVYLPPDNDFWTIVRVAHDSDYYPMGIDAGPMIVNRGGFFSANGTSWTQLSRVGSNTNANIRAVITPVDLAQDLGVARLLAPRGFVLPGSVTPVSTVKNYGTGTISSAAVRLFVTPGGYSSTRPVGSLAPGETLRLAFDDWTPASGGFFSVRCSTELAGDLNAANDRKTALASVADWTETFESNNGGYIADCWPSPGWVWGAPVSPRPTPHSGAKVWGAPLSGDYADAADWNLYSRIYTADIDSPAIAFYHWYRTENGTDGGNFCYSLDTGRTWQALVPWTDYCRDYDGLVYSLGGNGYTGARPTGWEVAIFRIPVASAIPFQLRWRFASDNSGADKGWIIDDVSGIGIQTPTSIAESPIPDPRPLTPELGISPNPVSALTRIMYFLPHPGPTSLKVYEPSGRLVSVLASGRRAAGFHSLLTTHYSLARGVYLLELRTPRSSLTRKFVVE